MTRCRVRAVAVRAAPWSAERWRAYYEANAEALLPLPWGGGAALPDAERDALAASLQDFQLGESSEGHHLLRRGAEYAAREGDPAYLDALRLFVREEQRHSRDLGRFLTLAGLPLLGRSRLDGLFRWLRHRGGLEQAITVLLTAETVGKVYYAAVYRATSSVLLRRLCAQLMRDEVQHVRFHAERLALLRRGRPLWRTRCRRAWHRLLFAGACVAVWAKHRRAFRAGGLGLGPFWRACWREMRAVLDQADPARYDVPRTVPNREAALV
jgi:hypothetical protein